MYITCDWNSIKTFSQDRGISIQYVDFNGNYYLTVTDKTLTLFSILSQEGGSDLTDFENNFKASSNKNAFTFFLDEDKIASEGWYLQPQYIEFQTSVLGSVVNQDQNGNDLGFTTIEFYKSDGTKITDQTTADTTCIKTVVQWQPTFNVAIFAVRLLQSTAPTSDIRVYRKQSPAEASKTTSTGGLNLALIGTGGEILPTLRLAPIIEYVSGHDYNKQEFTFTHNLVAGLAVKHKIGIWIQLWRK